MNHEIAQLRHLYANMVNGAVKDSAAAKRIAEGLLAPVIEEMERAITTPAPAAKDPDDSDMNQIHAANLRGGIIEAQAKQIEAQLEAVGAGGVQA